MPKRVWRGEVKITREQLPSGKNFRSRDLNVNLYCTSHATIITVFVLIAKLVLECIPHFCIFEHPLKAPTLYLTMTFHTECALVLILASFSLGSGNKAAQCTV